jgi:ArsR family transcriptional regulator
MEHDSAAQGFSAMGSPSRLEVLQVLVRAGNAGLPVGDIQKRTGIAASTLAHHIKFLSAADLIRQDKQGRTIINRANFEHLQSLAEYILHQCCSEEDADNERHHATAP